MPVVLDATPGSPTANSFATLDQANRYFAGMLYADDWTDADVDTQARALITATLLIVVAIGDGWDGWPTSTTQALPIPRSGLRSRLNAAIPSNVIPIELANATAEYARQLITLGAMPTAVSDLAGIKRAKLGGMEVELDVATFAGGADGSLPVDVFALIAFLVAFSRSRTCVPLERV